MRVALRVRPKDDTVRTVTLSQSHMQIISTPSTLSVGKFHKEGESKTYTCLWLSRHTCMFKHQYVSLLLCQRGHICRTTNGRTGIINFEIKAAENSRRNFAELNGNEIMMMKR